MSSLTKDLKGFFTLNTKSRHDSITDQYNRILMVKIMLAAVLITGLNWHKDDINCIVSETLAGKHMPGYVKSACWISGFYIFKELKNTPGFQGYYGIPTDITHNGTFGDSVPIGVRTCKVTGLNSNCKPMTKEFYLQYQYFPFLLGVMALLYYVPYMFFYRVNYDLRCLKRDIEKKEPEYDDICATYFSKDSDTFLQSLRIALNIMIKIAHLVVHIVVLELLDYTTNGNFRGFFKKWMDWTSLSNEDAYNYVGVREYIKPGENLLPTFGFCDVVEEGADIKHTVLNDHRFICEISQHVMYHYVLIALWVFITIGIIVSVVGIIEAIIRLLYHQSYITDDEQAAKAVYPKLSSRQRQYMDYVYKMNLERYGKMVRKLYFKFHPKPEELKNLLQHQGNEKEQLKEAEAGEKAIYA